MSEYVKPVRVQVRKANKYVVYSVTIPKDFARKLRIEKGTILHVVMMEMVFDGVKRTCLVYYKPNAA